MAEQYQIPFWGSLPLDSLLLQCCEEGKCFVDAHPTAPAAQALTEFAARITKAFPVEMGQAMKE